LIRVRPDSITHYIKEITMKTLRLFLLLTAGSSLLVGLSLTAMSSPVTPASRNLSVVTQQELARVRAATAKYHNVARAEANGYANLNFFEPGEGFHWEKGSLVDGAVDLEQPEDLIYANVPNENGSKLVAVEYLVPFDCDGPVPDAPQGFTGDADEWESENEDGFCFWKLTVWIWMHNPDGVFASSNPNLP